MSRLSKHAKWSDLTQWSSDPGLLSVLRLGRHRGERFDAVPEDYAGILDTPKSGN